MIDLDDELCRELAENSSTFRNCRAHLHIWWCSLLSLITISLVFSGNYHKTFCAFRFTASFEEALAGEENITDGLPKL
jgi:hypothetical protein